MRLKFSKFVVLPHNQLSLFVRKISFLFSSCIFTLLYSVFKVLLGTSFLCFRSLVGTSGLEPPTSRLSGVRSNHLSYAPISSGGDEEDRTPDPLRARQVLSQLSYTPI